MLAIKAVSDITGHGEDTADSFDENLDDVAMHAAHFTDLLVSRFCRAPCSCNGSLFFPFLRIEGVVTRLSKFQ